MSEEYAPKYEDFCRESKCLHYNLISRLQNMSKTSKIEKELGVAKVHCKQSCERTAQQFYQWITKTNN